MPGTPNPFPFKRLIPLTIMVALIIILLQGLSAEAASPPAPALGLTPTPTPTVTPTPLPAPTPTPQVGMADPAITKRGDPEKALPGEDVTFTLQVTNQGQQAAVGVVVTDMLPEYLEIVQVVASQGTVIIEEQLVTVEVGVVGPDFVVEIVILTRVRADTPVPLDMENVALLKSDNSGDRISPPSIITIPPPLLPPTGENKIYWPAYVVLGVVLIALSLILRKQKLA